MSTSPIDPSSSSSEQQLGVARANAKFRVSSRALWFIWIAGLSVINTVVTLSGGDFHLVYGLGITDLVNALAQRAGFGGIILDVVINGIAIGSFVLFWRFARQGHRWAFLVGMTFYLLDALILLPLKGSLLNIAFHAYALYGLFAGYQATNLLAKLNATGVNSDV